MAVMDDSSIPQGDDRQGSNLMSGYKARGAARRQVSSESIAIPKYGSTVQITSHANLQMVQIDL